ncbi:hypothetical protein [uncultured Marixanthomonas sp.]|uniref:hypothetical protein n=1 Tax=uncultured Marixanthomonas sp. TaxID=757245 RepID=UPI0030D88F78|tara:strand:- start:19180 stop:19926 length:747 start_codon:yes stop_codon:yes gene_type:complete
MKDYIRIIGFSLLASLLIFIGKNDLFLNWLVDKNILSSSLDIERTQLICFIIGIFWAGLWLPIEHSRLKSKQSEKDKQFVELLDYHKYTYFELIKNKLKEYNVSYSTRVFRPQKGIVGWWNREINKRTILELITIEGISDRFHHKTLHFEINKTEIQGLVGKCYNDKRLWVDLNLAENDYALTDQHRIKIGNVEFCSAIPIFNKDQTKVNAVLSVDSQTKFTFNEQNRTDWEQHMIIYGAFVDKHTNL